MPTAAAALPNVDLGGAAVRVTASLRPAAAGAGHVRFWIAEQFMSATARRWRPARRLKHQWAAVMSARCKQRRR